MKSHRNLTESPQTNPEDEVVSKIANAVIQKLEAHHLKFRSFQE